ncbi:DUF559 domain-containing protein [uncultured Corynebacterium sp.]|uniref:DUF559 domain-containing protein n=1 Tax=uncultured Corynebacterium sp. TaxID=159447 RepID=UPI0025EEEAC2|nr:DUF559 domain-containing protein [uncultured Corynebacterium sp.]
MGGNHENDKTRLPAVAHGRHPQEPELKTRSELLAMMTETDLRRALHHGWILRVRHGAYQLQVSELHLQMHLIAARAPEAVFAHLIAAFAWGLRKNPPRRLDVHVARSRRKVRGAVVHRREARSFSIKGGFRFTTLAATLADLVDIWGPAVVANVVDRNFKKMEQRAALIDEATALPARQRAKILPILEWAPEAALSHIEARIARALQMRGYDIELNIQIGQYTWDIVHRGAKLVIEYDSLKYHHNEWSFRDDRARQNSLTRCGYAILRYSDQDIDLRFGEMIDEICDTIDWLLGGEIHPSEWDRQRCGDVYTVRQVRIDEEPWR